MPSGGFNSLEVEAQIRKIVVADNSGIVMETETLLYIAGLAQKVGEHIIPALEKYEVVIVDRFILSILVIVCYMNKLDKEFANSILAYVSQGIKPDFTYLCDIDEEIAYDRMIKRGKPLSRREKKGIPLMRVLREGFLESISKTTKHFKIIDTGKVSLQEIDKYIYGIEEYFENE